MRVRIEIFCHSKFRAFLPRAAFSVGTNRRSKIRRTSEWTRARAEDPMNEDVRMK